MTTTGACILAVQLLQLGMDPQVTLMSLKIVSQGRHRDIDGSVSRQLQRKINLKRVLAADDGRVQAVLARSG